MTEVMTLLTSVSSHALVKIFSSEELFQQPSIAQLRIPGSSLVSLLPRSLSCCSAVLNRKIYRTFSANQKMPQALLLKSNFYFMRNDKAN